MEYYAKSENISIFPCISRGEDNQGAFDVEAKLTTEHNLSQLVRDIYNRDIYNGVGSFVVEQTSSGALVFVLAGYHVVLRDENILKNKPLWASCYINHPATGEHADDRKYQELVLLENGEVERRILDVASGEDYEFRGIEFSDAEPTATEGLYILQLLDEDGEVPDTSYLQWKTVSLADNAITTAKIADANITTSKIEDSAVTTSKIADLNVTTVKLNDDAVTTTKINNSAVTTDKIANAAVTEGKINDSAVTESKLNSDAVTTNKIKDGSVTEAKIDNGAVTTDKIGSQAVNESKIADDAVTEGKIADRAVTTEKIALNSIDRYRIMEGAIEESQLARYAVTTDKILDGSVTNDKLEYPWMEVGYKGGYPAVLGGIIPQATAADFGVVKVDTAMDSTSTNPVQNKVVQAALDNKANSSALGDQVAFSYSDGTLTITTK